MGLLGVRFFAADTGRIAPATDGSTAKFSSLQEYYCNGLRTLKAMPYDSILPGTLPALYRTATKPLS
jgi:hypothetical protein